MGFFEFMVHLRQMDFFLCLVHFRITWLSAILVHSWCMVFLMASVHFLHIVFSSNMVHLNTMGFFFFSSLRGFWFLFYSGSVLYIGFLFECASLPVNSFL